MKVLLYIIVLLSFLIPVLGFADEYLVDVYLVGKKVGSYLIYEVDGKLFVESKLLNDLGFPVDQDIPIEKLQGYAKVTFNKSTQTLVIEPTDPILFFKKNPFSSSPVIQYKDTSQPKLLDWKNIDYSLDFTKSRTHTSSSYHFRFTGNLYNFDYDFFLLPQKSGLLLERHNNGLNLKLGYIPEFNLTGISFSNEHKQFILSTFGVEYYMPEVSFNSVIDVFRNNEYLYTTAFTGQYLELPLQYGENIFLLVAKTPSGEVIKQEIKKSISSLVLPPGFLSYKIALGQNRNTHDFTYNLRLGYGLMNDLSVFFDSSKQEYSFKTVFYVLFLKTTFSVSIMDNKTLGQGYSLWLSHSHFNLMFNQYKERKFLNFIGSLPIWKFNFVYSHTENEFYTRNSLTSSKYLHKVDKVYLYTYFYRLFLSAYVGQKKDSDKYSIYGANVLFNISNNLKLTLNYEVEKKKYLDLRKERFQLQLSKWFSDLGELRFTQVYEKSFYESMKIHSSKLHFNLSKLRFASLFLSYEHYHRDNSYQIMAGITGTFTKHGFSNQQLSSSALVCFIPFLDANLNNRKDINEHILDVEIEIENYKTVKASKYYEPCIELSPYREYIIRFGDFFDVEPIYKRISITPERGKVLNVFLPYQEYEDLDGNLGKDGITVVAYNRITGERIAQAKTRLGGYYYFRIPKRLVNQVQVIPLSY